MAKKATTKKTTPKEPPVVLNMGFEEAMKKALNTPLPKKVVAKKKLSD